MLVSGIFYIMPEYNNNDTNTVNVKESLPPRKLSGLRQAIYIMKCLDAGEYFELITQKFDGDEQLVKLWMSFLLHNKCIRKNPSIDRECIVTEKGKRWMEKYDGSGTAAASATIRKTKNQRQSDLE
jgi:hypothetical protein